jgi:hypothetical protein
MPEQKPPPLYPPADPIESEACAAVAAGRASPLQQQIAVTWLMGKACAVNLPQYIPGDDPSVAIFNAGRAFVAQAFAHAAGVNFVTLPRVARPSRRADDEDA